MSLSPISAALDALRAGKPVIVADEELRRRERQVEALNRRLEAELAARREELSDIKQVLRESREALAVRYDYRNIVGRTPRVRSWLIDPGVEIPAEATAVHGITTEHARAHGTPAPDAIAQIRQALVDELYAGHPLVIFNAPFDTTMVDRECRRSYIMMIRHPAAYQLSRLLTCEHRHTTDASSDMHFKAQQWCPRVSGGSVQNTDLEEVLSLAQLRKTWTWHQVYDTIPRRLEHSLSQSRMR